MDNNKTLDKTDFIILIVLAGLTFCIAFGLSAPSLFMNDEWITVNQVYQLANGSQIIDNEGKYGRSIQGETSAYFIARDNYLAYSLFLPVVSLPALFGIIWAGDQFRLLFLLIWFIIGMGSLVSAIWLLNSPSRNKKVIIGWIVLGLFFGLFLINIYYFQPFIGSFSDSPIESAAAIFTNELLFASMTPMIYAVFRNIALDRPTSLVSAIMVICCSTYLFWSASAKDHLLVAFLLTAVFFMASTILANPCWYKWFSLFALSGLLCWARPEFGFVIFGGLVLWLICISMNYEKGRISFNADNWKQKVFFIPGLFTGLIPFFINNYVVTGNPFIPPQYLYLTSSRGTMTSVISTGNEISSGIGTKVINFSSQILTFFTPDVKSIIDDLLGLTFSPVNGGVGILFISPIILPALLFGLINRRSFKIKYSKSCKNMMIFSTIICIFTIIAYLRVIYGSTISQGSLPDMRYFSPIYLPLGIISLLLLSPLISKNATKWLKYILISVTIFAPLLVVTTIMLLPYGVAYNMYVYLFMRILLVILILIFGFAAFNNKIWNSVNLFPFLFSLLLVIPSSFQFLHLIIYSIGKSNGYYFWLPILEYLFTNVLKIIY